MKKKLIFLGTFLTVISGLKAQNGSVFPVQDPKPLMMKTVDYVAKPNLEHLGAKNLNVLWSEDFTTAVNGTGDVAFNTSNGSYIRSGSQGNYWGHSVSATSPINSQVNMVGRYMLWNSYTPNSNETNFSSTSVFGSIQTPTIDLSDADNNNISLSFITTTMYCCHPQQFPWKISVSTDDGVTFSAPIQIDFGVNRNLETSIIASPLPFTLDLSNHLNADPELNNEVVIRFTWDGVDPFNYPSGAFQMNTHYFWTIDNLSLFETPAFDVSLETAWLGDIIEDYEISEIPTHMAGQLTVQAALKNLGLQIPANTQIKVSVLNGATEVATATGGILQNNFANSNRDTITFATGIDLSALPVANYTVRFEVDLGNDEDANAANDIKNRTLRITQNSYATFNQDMPRTRESIGYFYSGAPAAESSNMVFGNVFKIDQNVTLQGVEMAANTGFSSAQTTINSEISVLIWRVSGDFQNPDFVAGPFIYNVTSNKLGAATSRFLYNLNAPETTSGGGESGPVSLMAGETYILSFSHDGGLNNHFFYWGTPRDDDNSNRGFDSQWWLFPEEPIIAANFDVSLNTGNFEIVEHTVFSYPNPTSDDLNIAFALNSNSDVSVEVFDLTGKSLFVENFGQMNSGAGNVTISTKNFAKGIYTFSLNANNSKVVKRFIVQ